MSFSSSGTLVDVLAARVGSGPGGFRFVEDGVNGADPTEASLSFADLDRRARDVAARLSETIPPGARAILIHPPGLEFVAAFFGAMYAGVLPVPVYPPGPGTQLPAALARIQHVAADARPEVVLSTALLRDAKDAVGLDLSGPGAGTVPWLATDDLSPGVGRDWVPRRQRPDDIAFLQYTSGSTAAPKGVVVRHRSVIANLEAIRRSMGLSADTTAVGWVPSYHDMGLIGFVLEAVYAGFTSYLIAPQQFLRRPALWLETISRTGAVVSGGPNFGFDLCTRRVNRAEMSALDLSSWEVAFSGAEKIRPDVLRRFAEHFAGVGFAASALYPCYGLAEASLLVSGALRGSGVRSRRLDRSALETGSVRPPPGAEASETSETSVEVASCGRVAAGHEVMIADPETGHPVPPGALGEVWFRGPSVTSGYWRRQEQSESVFGARSAAGEGPFLRTGDLGFLDSGELYLTGRLTDLLVLRGRNIPPTDVEEAVQALDPRLRTGCGAAFLADLTDGDAADPAVVMVQETTESDPDALRRLALDARREVADRLDVALGDLVLVRPHTIAKTSSGKLRRNTCRQHYAAGHLDPVYRLRPDSPRPLPLES